MSMSSLVVLLFSALLSLLTRLFPTALRSFSQRSQFDGDVADSIFSPQDRGYGYDVRVKAEKLAKETAAMEITA